MKSGTEITFHISGAGENNIIRRERGKRMVFTRPEVFDQNYIPEEYLYRLSEMQEIARCLSPLLKGHRGFNIKIYGEPATGKTTAVKKVF